MFGSIFNTLMNNSNNQTSYLPNRRFFFHFILAFTSKQWYRFIVWTPMKYQDFSSDENLVSSKETILTFTLWRFHCLIFLDKLFTYFKGQWRIVLIKCFMPYFLPYCYNILLILSRLKSLSYFLSSKIRMCVRSIFYYRGPAEGWHRS